VTQASGQLITQPLPYTEDSSLLFASIRHLSLAIFLDSAAPFSNRGRYDILSAEPVTVLKCSRAEYSSSQHFFQQLQQRLDETISTKDNPQGLPFIGGAMGFFNYDLGRQLEQLPAKAIDDINLPDALVGIYDWAIIVDHHQQQTVLVSQPSADINKQEKIKSLISVEPQSEARFTLKDRFQSNLTREAYQRAFDQTHTYIEAGDCYQINLAQRFSAPYKGDPWLAYTKLRQTAAAPYSAYMNADGCEILCLSPEQFIQLSDKTVITSPIKGTRPRGDSPQQDEQLARQLQASHKDQAENLMIVDLLRNDLGKSCHPGSIRVEKLFELQSFETVHHLVSTICGDIENDKQACDVMAACFPGGSITGAPKVRAMEIIEELEPHRRSIYCGSMGYISFDGQMDSNITIRTLLADQGTMHCWSGGGLVADSFCEGEYQESLSKVGKLLQALGDDQFGG
jgi:para-aminobenzoate synthetase component 1